MMKNLTPKGSNVIERHVKLTSLGDGFSLLANHENRFTALNSIKCEAPLSCKIDNHVLTISLDQVVDNRYEILSSELADTQVAVQAVRKDVGHYDKDLERLFSIVNDQEILVELLQGKIEDLEQSASEELTNSARYFRERFEDIQTAQNGITATLKLFSEELQSLRFALPSIYALEKKQVPMQAAIFKHKAFHDKLVWVSAISMALSIANIAWSIFK